MKTRLMLMAAFVLIAGGVFAQTAQTARTPRTAVTPQTPAAPQTAAPQAPAAPAAPPAGPATAPAPPPPPPPAPPGPARREGQPINVKVDLAITEDGGPQPPIRKAITAVVGDGYNGFVREQAIQTVNPGEAFDRISAPLNLDAFPVILPNGKIRLSCSIQYVTRGMLEQRRMTTDIKQNLVLILESGKPLVVSQATDPVGDRRVTVEVTATILR